MLIEKFNFKVGIALVQKRNYLQAEVLLQKFDLTSFWKVSLINTILSAYRESST